MKKFLLYCILLITLLSCNRYLVQNVYQNTYVNEEVALVDVYTHLYFYEMDSVYLDLWITNIMQTDTTVITQRTIRKVINEKSNYQFILTQYLHPSDLFYNFIIRYAGREKDMIKEPQPMILE